ncbi:hypothetical protein NECAME_13962 [Necator americanus]|uniref:Nucleotide-diphospho-sugar transferase domain-containing protein n=1 Tax=Necator americanus TaxID=51031 RepID=W2SR96_NECAM|nr:hypothetical protein NECAME_13962 [Necator americanus]ETN72155.1 hypothetical protein NECAME_13962 [Necator americanus]
MRCTLSVRKVYKAYGYCIKIRCNISCTMDEKTSGSNFANNHTVAIGIVSILEEGTTGEKYRTAMDSMECYALRYNYKFFVLNGADYRGECPQKDITFQRHCIVAHLLETEELDWILFVDSDIGVVNEKKRLEDMIIPNKDIIFYNRFFNHEVMAGSFFARRSKTSIEFLRGWANYEFRLPNSFHGRDNGAIHMWLLEQIKPMKKCSYVCHSLWNASIDYATLSYFTGEGWARDGWLTNSHWNSSPDFMFHARKERDKEKYKANEIGELSGPEFFLWFDTLRSPLELQQCHNAPIHVLLKKSCVIVSAGWDHDPALIVPHGDILRHLKNRRDIVCWEYQQMTAEIKKKYKIESRKGNVKEKMTKSSNDEQTDNWIC